jgi:site-specific DNA-methyltransferase (adenine-specific)
MIVINKSKMSSTSTDFTKMTLSELKNYARQQKLKGFSILKKKELISKLQQSTDTPPKLKIKLKSKKKCIASNIETSNSIIEEEDKPFDTRDYITDDIKLYHGDCLEKMSLIPDDSVDLVLCDLPYGTTKCKWDTVINMDKLWEHYRRIIKKPHGVIVLFGQQPFTSMLVSSNYKWYKYNLIWKKNKTTQYLLANYRPMKCTEDICVFSPGGAAAASRHKGNMTYNPQGLIPVDIKKKNSAKRIGKMLNQAHHLGPNNKLTSNTEYRQKFTNYPTEFIEFDIEFDTIHETQKPVPLIEYLIKTYSNEVGVVVDNAMGSGTTGVGCVNTKRNFIGIELDSKYFELSKKRILNEYAKFNAQVVKD